MAWTTRAMSIVFLVVRAVAPFVVDALSTAVTSVSTAGTGGRSLYFPIQKRPEDLAEQVVGREGAGDLAERIVREAQFLGEQISAASPAGGQRIGAPDARAWRSACTWRVRAMNTPSGCACQPASSSRPFAQAFEAVAAARRDHDRVALGTRASHRPC